MTCNYDTFPIERSRIIFYLVVAVVCYAIAQNETIVLLLWLAIKKKKQKKEARGQDGDDHWKAQVQIEPRGSLVRAVEEHDYSLNVAENPAALTISAGSCHESASKLGGRVIPKAERNAMEIETKQSILSSSSNSILNSNKDWLNLRQDQLDLCLLINSIDFIQFN